MELAVIISQVHTGFDVNIPFKLGLDNQPLLFVVISVAYYENNYGYFLTCKTIETFSPYEYYVMGMSGDLVIGLTQCLLTILLTCSFIIIQYYFSYIYLILIQKPIIFTSYSQISYQDLAFFSRPNLTCLIQSFLAGEIHLEKTPVAKIQDSDSFRGIELIKLK